MRQLVMSLVLCGTAIAAAQAPPPPGNPAAFLPKEIPTSAKPEVHYGQNVVGLYDVTYSTVPGYRPLKLDLFYAPAASTARPAVIWIHGGGWRGGNPLAGTALVGERDQLLAKMAGRGYVMVGLTYRFTGEAQFPAQVNDVKAAVRWLRANAAAYQIDPQRIAVWGASAGGYLASLVGTSCKVAELEGDGGNPDQSSCVQAVVDWFGPIDFKHLLANGPNAGLTAFLGCSGAACGDELLQRSNPVSYLSANTPPFLIMHGDADTLVPISESTNFLAALKAKGVSARMETIHGANHEWGGADKAQVDHIYEVVQQFLDSTFGVKPPGK